MIWCMFSLQQEKECKQTATIRPRSARKRAKSADTFDRCNQVLVEPTRRLRTARGSVLHVHEACDRAREHPCCRPGARAVDMHSQKTNMQAKSSKFNLRSTGHTNWQPSNNCLPQPRILPAKQGVHRLATMPLIALVAHPRGC